jgi:hypothetical protein
MQVVRRKVREAVADQRWDGSRKKGMHIVRFNPQNVRRCAIIAKNSRCMDRASAEVAIMSARSATIRGLCIAMAVGPRYKAS